MTVTVVVGPPCAGKSTFVAESAQPGDVIVDFDKIATALGSGDPHDAPWDIKRVAWGARYGAIQEVLARDLEVDAWLIHTQPKSQWMDQYTEAGVVFHFIDPGKEVCLERAKSDERPEWTAAAIEDWYVNGWQAPTEEKAQGPIEEKSMSATATLAARKDQAEREHAGAAVKSVTVKFKTDGLAEGEFTGYASVFGNKDSYGDVVLKGAFANTLAEWARKGVPIPLLWGHNTADPDFNLGEIVTAEEDDHGLKVHGRLDMESPKSAQTYRLLKSGRVNQMSFAYSIVDGAYVEPISDDGTTSWRDAYYELRELDLYEVSIVPIGANQETEILAVKSVVGSLAAKAGKTLSTKSQDAIRAALAQAEEIVSSLKSVLPEDNSADKEDQDQTSGKEPSSDDTTKSSDATTPSPSVLLALAEIQIAEGVI